MSADRFFTYLDAHEGAGIHEVNVAFLESEFDLRVPDDAAVTPRALLEWIRDPNVHVGIEWPRDMFTTGESGDPVAVGHDARWSASIRTDDTGADPIVEIHELGADAAPQRLLGRMTLAELTTRILYREPDWSGVLHDATGHGLDDLGSGRRILEPMTLGHQMRASWAGIGLGPYWCFSFFGPTIRVRTDEPERLAAEFAGHQHLVWLPRDDETSGGR